MQGVEPADKASMHATDKEKVPATPQLKANPTIVTPKVTKDEDLGLLILEEQAEISNLTAPEVGMAGPIPGASQEEDVDTVMSATSTKSGNLRENVC
jgi:hypothetical protein